MYVDISYELEREFKIAMIERSPRLTLKDAMTEAIKLWIEKQNNEKFIEVRSKSMK